MSALPGDPSHAVWLRHCTGANGLLTVELDGAYGIGRRAADRQPAPVRYRASWGSEDLVIPVLLASRWTPRHAALRLHIGLGPTENQIGDLEPRPVQH